MARTTKSLGAIRPPIGGSEALSLSEQIASQLAESIVQGEYEPGDRIHVGGVWRGVVDDESGGERGGAVEHS